MPTSIDDMPPRIARLPRDSRGFPVPKFATWPGGQPDFRFADTEWTRHALTARRCFICGESLGQYLAFVIGPMCAVNRTTSDPPIHLECALYAVKACPFLAFPNRKRDHTNAPDNIKKPPGFMLERNPGVALVWVTKSFRLVRSAAGGAGRLINLGDPTAKYWFRQGRPATLAEVLAAVESGLPHLRKIARDHDGPEGERALEDLIATTIKGIREDSVWASAAAAP